MAAEIFSIPCFINSGPFIYNNLPDWLKNFETVDSFHRQRVQMNIITPGRLQLKKLLTINEHGSKIDRNSVFDCHLLPVWQQIAIENSVSNNFLFIFLDSVWVFDCRLLGVIILSENCEYFIISLFYYRKSCLKWPLKRSP